MTAQLAGGRPTTLVSWLPGSPGGSALSQPANMSLPVWRLPLSLTLGSSLQLPVRLEDSGSQSREQAPSCQVSLWELSPILRAARGGGDSPRRPASLSWCCRCPLPCLILPTCHTSAPQQPLHSPIPPLAAPPWDGSEVLPHQGMSGRQQGTSWWSCELPTLGEGQGHLRESCEGYRAAASGPQGVNASRIHTCRAGTTVPNNS